MDVKELAIAREQFYTKIKEELTPQIITLVQEAEKTKGYLQYWNLYKQLNELFGLRMDDYDRIISDLNDSGAVQQNYRCNIGGFLNVKK